MNDATIGIQIKKARAESQLTQADLGKKIGVTWEMVSRYENGKSSPRKNLDIIAEVLGKPIQYFFGVEEVPLQDEIKRLTELLIKKSTDLQRGSDLPLIETLNGFTLKKALELAKQTYSCPAWIFSNFKKIFALRLDDIASDIVSIGRGDIGFFTQDRKPQIGDYMLVKQGKKFQIIKESKGNKKKSYAILLAVEKRYSII